MQIKPQNIKVKYGRKNIEQQKIERTKYGKTKEQKQIIESKIETAKYRMKVISVVLKADYEREIIPNARYRVRLISKN